MGCDRVLVDGVKIRNQLNAPNCDGIDPAHSRDVENRNCDVVCGDDAIVVRASRAFVDHGETANIHVHDCTIETQDSGLKVGPETTSQNHHVRFERCTIRSISRQRHAIEHEAEKLRAPQIAFPQFNHLGRGRLDPVARSRTFAHRSVAGPRLTARAHAPRNAVTTAAALLAGLRIAA